MGFLKNSLETFMYHQFEGTQRIEHHAQTHSNAHGTVAL
jgi:hypothetical protein